MSTSARSVSPDTRYHDALQLNSSQFPAAIAALEELLAQHPEHQASLSLLIKALMNDKRPQDARTYLPLLKLKKDMAARDMAVDVYVACRDYTASLKRCLKKKSNKNPAQ